MSPFVLACPKTCKPITAEISTEPEFMRRAWHTTLRIPCRHCGGAHEISFRDAYVAAVLDGTGSAPSHAGPHAHRTGFEARIDRTALPALPRASSAKPAAFLSAVGRRKAAAIRASERAKRPGD